MVARVDMTSKYNRLTEHERHTIRVLWAQGYSKRAIAKALGRQPSTITREFKRTGKGTVYTPELAHHVALKKRSISRKRPRLKDSTIRAYVEEKIKRRWSPELIAGRLHREYPGFSISHEAIYQWVYAEAPSYIPFLTRRHRKRRRRGAGNPFRAGAIPCRVGIEQRPTVVAHRGEAGHWEADTVVSKRTQSAALQILVERKSRYTLITPLSGLTAYAMRDALIRKLRRVPPSLRKTITYDNGRENACHVMVNNMLGMKSYFCHPYSSWERGTVENTIGLIRRFFPKKTDFGCVKHNRIKMLQQWINHRPRKCLNYQTPAEVYRKECCAN